MTLIGTAILILIFMNAISHQELRLVDTLVIWLSGALTWFFSVYQFVYIEENAAIQGYEHLKNVPCNEKVKEAKESLKSTIEFLSQSRIRHLIRMGGVYAGIVPAMGILTYIFGRIIDCGGVVAFGEAILIFSLIVITVITIIAGCQFACFFTEHKPREKYLKALLCVKATKKQLEQNNKGQ